MLKRLALISDADKREIDDARSLLEHDMAEAVAGAGAAFDVITAHRAGACKLPENFDEEVQVRLSQAEAVAKPESTDGLVGSTVWVWVAAGLVCLGGPVGVGAR